MPDEKSNIEWAFDKISGVFLNKEKKKPVENCEHVYFVTLTCGLCGKKIRRRIK